MLLSCVRSRSPGSGCCCAAGRSGRCPARRSRSSKTVRRHLDAGEVVVGLVVELDEDRQELARSGWPWRLVLALDLPRALPVLIAFASSLASWRAVTGLPPAYLRSTAKACEARRVTALSCLASLLSLTSLPLRLLGPGCHVVDVVEVRRALRARRRCCGGRPGRACGGHAGGDQRDGRESTPRRLPTDAAPLLLLLIHSPPRNRTKVRPGQGHGQGDHPREAGGREDLAARFLVPREDLQSSSALARATVNETSSALSSSSAQTHLDGAPHDRPAPGDLLVDPGGLAQRPRCGGAPTSAGPRRCRARRAGCAARRGGPTPGGRPSAGGRWRARARGPRRSTFS